MDGFYDQQVPFVVPPNVRLSFNFSSPFRYFTTEYSSVDGYTQ